MPASRTVEKFDGLEFSVEPCEEPDPVFFTEDDPEFEGTIKNNDSKYEWAEGSKFGWTIVIGEQELIYSGVEHFGPLDYREKTTVTVGGETLAYEGHGVFGINVGTASGTDSGRWALNARQKRPGDPAYSYSVWDKSHYEASIQWPKRLQIAIILTSFVLIVFAAVQVAIVLL